MRPARALRPALGAGPAIDRVGAMTTVGLADELCAAFPEVRIAIITAEGVRGDQPWPRVASELAELEQQAADGRWAAPDEDNAHIASWHATYRRFGTNPRRQRPSMDALCRRLGRTGRLPRITSVVDCYNLVSVRHVLPAGAFDRDAVAGDITITFARGDEQFTPLGEPDTTEIARAGEVIYRDAESVLTRHWNHRDADRTKVTAKSRDIIFQLESVSAEVAPVIDDAAAELVGHLREHADDVRIHLLSADNRTVTPSWRELTRKR